MNKGIKNKDNTFFSYNGYKNIRIDFTSGKYERILTDNKYFRERLKFS